MKNYQLRHFGKLMFKQIFLNAQKFTHPHAYVRNKRQLFIALKGLFKFWLNFTKAENENQYLTNITNNITFYNVLVGIG